jgi:hypothetical protein
MGLPQEIPYLQAPCRSDGEISRDGQEESKEGTCRCSVNPRGCCVDAIGIIIPKVLKAGASLPVEG